MSSTGNDQGNDSQKGSKPYTPKGKDKVSSKESTPKGDGSVGGYHRPPHDIPSMFPEDPVDYNEALGGYIDRQRRKHGTTGPSARGPTPAGGPGPVVRKETHSTTSATSMLTCGPASNLTQQTQAGLNYWRGMWAINFTSPKASMLTYLVPRTQAEMDAFLLENQRSTSAFSNITLGWLITLSSSSSASTVPRRWRGTFQ
jgi:hypothetical protein